jgi:hypothetical protein
MPLRILVVDDHATKNSPQPDPPVTAELVVEGPIETLSAPDTIVVSGRRIQLDAQSAIRSGSLELTFADLRLGARSRVTGQVDGNILRGKLIEVLDPVGTPTHLHGVVSGVTSDGNVFQFRIDKVGGTCISLAPSGSVEATGTQNGNTVVARQVTFR